MYKEIRFIVTFSNTAGANLAIPVLFHKKMEYTAFVSDWEIYSAQIPFLHIRARHSCSCRV